MNDSKKSKTQLDLEQIERFKALAASEGLDTQEAQENFKNTLKKIAKGKKGSQV